MNSILNVRPEAQADIAAAYDRYGAKYRGLGLQFFDPLAEAFHRITDGLLHYAEVKHGIRRKLLKQWSYADLPSPIGLFL